MLIESYTVKYVQVMYLFMSEMHKIRNICLSLFDTNKTFV